MSLIPEGVSWKIETLDGQVLFEAGFGTYFGKRFEFVTETVVVPPGAILNLAITTFEGGVTQALGPLPNDIANVFLGDKVDFGKTLARVNTNSRNGLSLTTSFMVSEAGIIPQETFLTGPTPAPTAMVPASLAGFLSQHYPPHRL